MKFSERKGKSCIKDFKFPRGSSRGTAKAPAASSGCRGLCRFKALSLRRDPGMCGEPGRQPTARPLQTADFPEDGRVVSASAPSMAGCREFSIAAVWTRPQREYLSRPGEGDGLFRKFRVTGQKFLRKAEVPPLVHREKAGDVRCL